MLLEIEGNACPPPSLNESDVMVALAKIKKTASGTDNIPYSVWSENASLLAPLITYIWNLSLYLHTWPKV